ncbi:siphovirus ReqiPepy6 Gp37-like family protein [Streptomyces albidoflavus]
MEDTHNNVGAWKLILPAEHHLADTLRTPGAGIVVTGPTDVLMSGPVTVPEYAATPEDPGASITFEGVSDSVTLADMLAYPEPANPDATTQAAGHDERSGPAESVMHAYVTANCGPAAPAPRRRPLLTMGTDLGRGPVVTKAARFPVLGELLSEIASVAQLGFRIVQRGQALVFETYEVADRTREIRLDTLTGTLAGQRVTVSPPAVTRVIVAGQGELEDRHFVTVDSPDSLTAEADWGRRIERFVDQRQTDDAAELKQAGDEALAEGGATTVAVQAVPADDAGTMRYGTHWQLGDRVTVVAGGQELVSVVTGMKLKADSDGFRLGVLLGDPTGFRTDAAGARVSAVESRVSSLERTAEATPPGVYGLNPADYQQTTPPTAYPEGDSALTMNSTQASAGGWEFGGGGRYGTLRTVRPVGSTYAVQTWHRLSPTVPEQWERSGSDAGGWARWRQLVSRDITPRGIVALQTLGDTEYIGDAETIVYRRTFTAEAGRCYKIHLRVPVVDADSTGDAPSVRYAKQAAYTFCRWASGTTVSASSATLGAVSTTVYDDDSTTATGVDAAFFLNNPPAGSATVGIGLTARRAAATYGKVRYLSGATTCTLAIEDVGPAV